MKKITAIIAVLAVAAFVVAGCQKQEAPKSAPQTAVTSTLTSTATTTAAPAAMPEKK
jgi:PBP1b-binding outer membrane lipoprotein LpoB